MSQSLSKLIGLMALMLMLLAPAGCTVKPVVVSAQEISFDGNNQNAGLLGFTEEGAAVITPRARERYNALIVIYGIRFVPPLKADDGIMATGTNAYVMDAEHLNHFKSMNRWQKVQ